MSSKANVIASMDLGALVLLAACGARTEILDVAARVPPAGADSGGADAAATTAAGSSCGGSGQACCAGNGGCAVGLVCNGGSCTAPGQARLVLFGGNSGFSDLGDTWLLDRSRWTKVSVSPSPSARNSASLVTLGGQVVLFGGVANGEALDDTWVFDGASWSEVSVANRPPARTSPSMASLGDEVVLFGGMSATDGNVALTDTWTFDGVNWTQVTGAHGPPMFNYMAATTFGSEVVVVGQDYGSFQGHHEAWAFDGSSWSQLGEPPFSGLLQVLSASTLGNDLVLLGSGYPSARADTYENETWTFEGSVWSHVASGSPTLGLQDATLVSLDGQVLLVGGQYFASLGGPPLGDMAAFDGSSWSTMTASNPPSDRSGASVAVLP